MAFGLVVQRVLTLSLGKAQAIGMTRFNLVSGFAGLDFQIIHTRECFR